MLPYIVAKCVGAIAASLALGWILGPVGNFGATLPALPLAQSFALEVGYTPTLGFPIMGMASYARTPAAVAPFTICTEVFAGALATGALIGGSFNPARTLGLAVPGGVWTAHWLYWIAPVHRMTAMHVYEWLRGASMPEVPQGGLPLGVDGPIAPPDGRR